MTNVAYAYLHGFGSSPASRKAKALEAALAARGIPLIVPDLNQLSLGELRLPAIWQALSELDASLGHPQWRLIGCSLGGWLALRMAAEWKRVDRAVLLSTPEHLRPLWDGFISETSREAWRIKGALPLPDVHGKFRRVHYAFYEDICAWGSGTLHAECPLLLVHGLRDRIISTAEAQHFASRTSSRLIQVDADHELIAELDFVIKTTVDFITRDDAG